jgi:hypothetical protein
MNSSSKTNEQQFNYFQEWFDYEHQRIEKERLLQTRTQLLTVKN